MFLHETILINYKLLFQTGTAYSNNAIIIADINTLVRYVTKLGGIAAVVLV
jgi:hypothetical protein